MSNKTSDKNVENIETVIKDCREHLKLYGEAFITADELDRIEKILAEREQDKKRIQELEEERDHWHGCFIVAMENSIATQKVIDKIKEYDKKMEEDAGHPNWVVTDRIVMNVLQELLETK